MDIKAQFEERVRRLRGQYVETLIERHDRLTPILEKLISGTALKTEVTQARFDIHKIAGTAASFSYLELGEAASAANRHIDSGDLMSREAHVAFQQIMAALDVAVATDRQSKLA